MSDKIETTLSESIRASLLPSLEEMRAFEAATLSEDVNEQNLMDLAGSGAAKVVYKWYASEYGPDHPFTVLCGPGNNGGDGLAMARRMREGGAVVNAVVVHSMTYSTGLKEQIKSYLASGEQIFLFSEETIMLEEEAHTLNREALHQILSTSWLVVDALLGTGQKDAPRGAVKAAIEVLNEARKGSESQIKCISLDVPSGVSAETGEVFSPHVTADNTLTIELIKRGMIQFPAREACGRLVVVPIDLKCDKPTEYRLIVPGSPSIEVPKRPLSSHKGNFGQVFVVAGSPGMPGAALLTARAALRTGAGLVTRTEFNPYAVSVDTSPEIMLEIINRDLNEQWLEQIKKHLKLANCSIIGPGLGQDTITEQMILELLTYIQEQSIPCVLDADCLNIIAKAIASGKKFSLPSAIITPHPGEMARLLGSTVEHIQKDRYLAGHRAYDLLGSVVVLKGASSVVIGGKGGYVNLTGNPFMATAGSGDVLSGMVASFKAQGKSLLDAALSGVYYHGLAGDLAHASKQSTIIASDIIEAIPSALANPTLQTSATPQDSTKHETKFRPTSRKPQ